MSRQGDLDRIGESLRRAVDVVRPFLDRPLEVEQKAGGDPVTEADRALDDALRGTLPRNDE